MRFYPRFNILKPLLTRVIVLLFLTFILGFIYWLITYLIQIVWSNDLFNFKIIFYFYIFFIVIAILHIFYNNLRISYVDFNLNNHILFVKYFMFRPESDLKIMLNDIKLIQITGIMNHEKYYKIFKKSDSSISVDLSAIPDKELLDISNIYNFKIETQIVSD